MRLLSNAFAVLCAMVLLLSAGAWKDIPYFQEKTMSMDSLSMRGPVKVAVLPFDIRTLEVSVDTSMMQQETQEVCMKAIAHQNREAQILEQNEIRSVLASKGVGEHLAKYVNPGLVASWFGVDFVVFGMADISKKYLPVSGFTSSDSVFIVENKSGDLEEDTKNNNHTFHSESAYMRMVYSTEVSLTIYDKSGKEVFSSARRGVGQGIYAYQNAIKYVVKRSPFNKRIAKKYTPKSKKTQL